MISEHVSKFWLDLLVNTNSTESAGIGYSSCSTRDASRASAKCLFITLMSLAFSSRFLYIFLDFTMPRISPCDKLVSQSFRVVFSCCDALVFNKAHRSFGDICDDGSKSFPNWA